MQYIFNSLRQYNILDSLGNSKESLQKERKSVQPKVIPKILDENSQKIWSSNTKNVFGAK